MSDAYSTPTPPPAALPPGGSPVLERFGGQMEQVGADHRATFEQSQAALAPKYSALSQTLAQPRPAPPQQQQVAPAPKPEEFQKDAMAFASAMAVLGAVAGRFTRTSGEASLNAFAGAVNGWQAGNRELYDTKVKEWEANTKKTIENNRQVLDAYKQTLDNRKANIDEQMSQIQLIAAQYHDKMMFDAAAAKNYTLVADIYQKNFEYTKKTEESAAKLKAKYDEDQKKLQATANYWMSPEGVTKRVRLSPEQNAAIDKMIQHKDPKNVALERFLEENPDATAQQIQQFQQQARPPRSAQAMSLAAYIEEGRREGKERTSDDIQKFQAKQAGLNAEERTGATTAANLDIIMRNAHAAIPMAVQASQKVPRGTWVPINKLMQTADSNISDPALKEFKIANLQLAELWARAMNPKGVMRESDRELALQMLSTADSPQTYERVAKQLENFLQRERKAVQEFREHKEPEQHFNPSAPSPTAGGAPHSDLSDDDLKKKLGLP